MPILPSPHPVRASFVDRAAAPSQYAAAMRAQWMDPHDLLSFLMLVGGDIVQCAVAQLAGTGPGPFTPVAFSFGWLAFSISALKSALGDGRLLPPPDCPSVLVNARSRYARTNQSWVLGRLLRDEEHRLQHSTKYGYIDEGAALPDHGRREKSGGLTIAFYHSSLTAETTTAVPSKDWVYWTGVVVIVLQNLISTIPFFLHGDWVVFLVTFSGTVLALLGSAIPQWRDEKYAARPVAPGKREVNCLTRGNGAPVAMVFIFTNGLRLEDLAAGKNEHSHFTLVATIVLCICWVLLLLTVEGLAGDSWYLLGIGALGMAQNVLAAGGRRTPRALGFHVEEGIVIKERKVMAALQKAEELEPGVGLSLLSTFFPGPLRPAEKEWWDQREKLNDMAEKATKGLGKTSDRFTEDEKTVHGSLGPLDRANSQTPKGLRHDTVESSASSMTAFTFQPEPEQNITDGSQPDIQPSQ